MLRSQCISPSEIDWQDTKALELMFSSHDWHVQTGKQFTDDGALVHIKCSRCGAWGHAIVTTEK